MNRLIDANIILRYLLKDHMEMSEKARIIVEEVISFDKRLMKML